MHPKLPRILLLVLAAVLLLFFFTSHTSQPARNRLTSFLDPYGSGSTLSTGHALDADGEEETGGYVFLPLDLAEVFPPPDKDRRLYHEWNARSVAELHACMSRDKCGPNQRKVALLAAHWFEEATVRGWRGGEGVWGLSMYRHLRAMGYTTLFANSFEEALEQYRMFPSLVKVVVRNKAGECHSSPKCVKGPTNPAGIPAWKIFDFEYFPSSHGMHYHASLMKGKWILSANPDVREPSPIQYIGFSMEKECTPTVTIPLAQREHRAWLLMKQLTYVYDGRFAWNQSYFTLASAALTALQPPSETRRFDMVGAWLIDQHYQWKPDEQGIMEDIEDREHGLVNLLSVTQGEGKGRKEQKKMGPEEWEREVGRSKVMVGVGNPFWSPSPYHALCLGVPFVNPIINWDRSDPWNKQFWHTQHPSLTRYDPPFVYNVHSENFTGFVHAIHEASKTEIPSFIPPHMTEAAVRERVRILMETDWKEQARVLLEERIQQKEKGMKDVYTFEL